MILRFVNAICVWSGLLSVLAIPIAILLFMLGLIIRRVGRSISMLASIVLWVPRTYIWSLGVSVTLATWGFGGFLLLLVSGAIFRVGPLLAIIAALWAGHYDVASTLLVGSALLLLSVFVAGWMQTRDGHVFTGRAPVTK